MGVDTPLSLRFFVRSATESATSTNLQHSGRGKKAVVSYKEHSSRLSSRSHALKLYERTANATKRVAATQSFNRLHWAGYRRQPKAALVDIPLSVVGTLKYSIARVGCLETVMG